MIFNLDEVNLSVSCGNALYLSVNRTAFMFVSMWKFLSLSVREGIFVKNFPLVVAGILTHVSLINSYHAMTISLNCDLLEVSSLKDFFRNLYTFTYFCHHTVIYSFINLSICIYFDAFFYNKVFSTSHIAREFIN